jgi:hypothetical protein
MTSARYVSLSVSVFLLVVPATATAQAPPAPRVADAGDQAFESGRALYKAGRVADAEAAFARAWVLKKTQDIAANLGSVELENKKYRRAAEHLAYAVRHGAPSDSDKARQAARERLDAALKFVGTVHLRVQPDGAGIYLNGELVGHAPLEGDLYVDADASSVVEAKLEGFENARAEVRVGAGLATDARLELGGHRRSKVPAIVLGGLGVVGLGLGATFIGLEASKRSDAQSLATQTAGSCPITSGGASACAQLRSAASSSDTFGDAGVAAFVVGGAFVAGAVTYLLWPARGASPATTGVRVAPLAGASTGGLVVSGSF